MIKVLGNIGEPVQYVYDSKYTGMEGGPGDRRLVQALLQCAYNTDLPHKVSKAAVLALHKMTFSPEMKDVLFGILVDLNRPPSLRTAIFERLVLQPDRDLATKLHDLVYTEKMIYMENYMITYIKSLLQNDQPDLQHLRNIWQDLIDSDSRAFPYGSRQIGKSKYIEMSRYIRFPLSTDYHGFQIELDTVYNIASPIVNAIVLRVSYFAGHKINLLEVAADIDDFHVLVNEVTRILPLGVPIQPRNSRRETVFATLQKDIVAAILEMFDEINLPQKSIPDGLIHVKVLGKEVCFLDIRDLQKKLLNKRSGQSFINTSKRYFYAILEQLPMYRTSSTSLVDIVKVLPTVGGFPLNMTVSVAMTIGLGFNAKLTMPDILKLNTDAQLDTSIKSHAAVHLNGELMTRFGQHSLSGARASSYGLLQMSLEPSLRVNTQPYPGRPLDISVTQTNTDSKYNIARLSGNLYLMTPSGEMEEVEPDQEIQTTIHDCDRGLLSAVTGNQVCFTGVFPNTTSSTSHPYFPLSGPFHFSLDTRKVETENFQNSTFRILKFEDHLWINLTRQGQDKKNGLILHIETRDYLHQVEMLIPAAQLHFYAKKDYTWSYGVISTDYQIYDFHLSEAGTSIIRFLVKVQGNKTLSRNRISILTKRRIVDVTLAIPGASLAVTVHSFKNKTSGHYNNAFNITYHCIKDRPLMYLLHWNPTLAVLNGDTSTVQFVNDVVSGYIGDTNIWRANDYMQLNLPGLKVSLDNNIEGNMTHANHQAVIVYGGALGQEHTLTMDAHVTNSSNTTYNSYNCYMLLSHTAMPYNLSVWGFLKGTSQNLYILAEIEHVAISNAVQETPLVRDSNKNDSEDWLIGLSGIGNAESSGTDDCMKIPIRKVAALTVARVPVPDGIELRWDLNYTKQLCEGHVLYRTSGVYGRQPVNTRSNFHYWFTADAAITESSNSEGQHKPVVSTKSYKGRFIFHVDHLESIHLLLDYSSQLVNTSYVLRTYEIPKKSKCALFHYKLHTPWPLFNFNIRHFYNWTDHLIHEMDVALAFVDVDTVSHYHMRLFSDLFKIEVNGSINSRLPWLQGRSNITGYFKQHVSHGILPQLLVAAETSEGTLELKADMINTTLSTTNITFQKPNDEIAHLFTWDIALTSSRAITHTLSWNSDLVNLLLQGAGTKVNQLRLALLEAGEVALRNAGKSTHLMVIPFTNMTLGAMLESYLYPHMRINMNDSDPRSLYMDDKSLNMSDDVGIKGSNQPGTPWPYEANIVVAGNEVLGIMSRTIGETLKTMDRVIFRPPRIVNCVGNYLLRPTIQKILSESRLTFTLPVIGHWQTLLSSPHGTYGYRYLKGVFKRLTSKDPVKSDKSVTAYIINRQYVITYYGQHYHIPDDEAADCVHLLAADFDRETFAILLSRQGITVVTSEMSVMLEFGGNVFRDNCPRPVQLPLGCNGCQTGVFMEGDDVVLTITNGVRVSCRHQREVCSIQLTGKQFSHSWGLLGSNDGEPGSDFQLPNKHITSLTNNFIHGYAVGGPPKCISSKYSHQNETNEVINPHHRSPSNVTTRCSTEMADECNRQFMHASNYSTCDSYVSSQQFLDSCLSEARNCDRVASDACKHINAYEYACHLNVVYDILHVNCSIDTSSSFVEGSRQPVDIVMVMSENLGSSRSDLEAHMETFLHHVKYSLHNVQLGIIGYGDDVEITDALDLTLSSRYMVALERLDVGMDISPWRKAWKRFPNVNTMNEALDMAANYPYRLNTQRVVIVISREKNPYISNSVKSRYEDMNIIVNSFGDYESIIPSNKVNGINWDSTVVYRDWMSAYRVLSLPEGDLVELVINTKGTIFNADTIFNRRKKRLRFILKHIKEQIQLNNVC
ncbi:uncharacterized protein LOC132561593 [Ylistrum balloti]|uniref:uncharacterized protein LOC132561593 n=1 Tax=Ylistrum balloti TaxID=509963 RepID=UPI002905DAFA|nr:uncharacterized protein LOC132561593 [Ylistrum balloti]